MSSNNCLPRRTRDQSPVPVAGRAPGIPYRDFSGKRLPGRADVGENGALSLLPPVLRHQGGKIQAEQASAADALGLVLDAVRAEKGRSAEHGAPATHHCKVQVSRTAKLLKPRKLQAPRQANSVSLSPDVSSGSCHLSPPMFFFPARNVPSPTSCYETGLRGTVGQNSRVVQAACSKARALSIDLAGCWPGEQG